MKSIELKRCEDFLSKNGYIKMYSEESLLEGEEYQTFYKKDEAYFSIDINGDEIVMLDGNGDFLHLPCSYYTLIGVLIYYNQITVGFKR